MNEPKLINFEFSDEKIFAKICSEVIDPQFLAQYVQTPASGAVVNFLGNVRNIDDRREVVKLEYEVHPSALDVLISLSQKTILDFPIHKLAVVHRYGSLEIGECAFAVSISSQNRSAAFGAITSFIDAVKEEIPVWKHQFFSDGTDEWVGSA